MATHFLSKTSFIRGLQCTKSLYLSKHHSKLKDPLPEERKQRFAIGHQFGFRARNLFPGGIDASPFSVGKMKESIRLTKELIQKDQDVIYEAAFLHDDVLVYVDILVKTADGWIANEVKSSVSITDTYRNDAALQYYVIMGSGLKLIDFTIIHLKNLFHETKITDPVEELFQTTSVLYYCQDQQTFIGKKIELFRNVIAYPKSPPVEMGEHCNVPYVCDFSGFCTKQKKPLSEGLFNQEV